jgi:hypothetical protein
MSEVKVYAINWQDGDYNSFIGKVVSLADFEKATKELAEKDAEIMRLKERLLTFEGMTFSEHKPK